VFGIDSTELMIVALAALIFLGPKELPSALRAAGRWVARIRAHARHFSAGLENIVRDAELAELEANWQADQRHKRADITTSPGPVPTDGPAERLRP
jgi:sec-independent protein translocase protein TatB